MTAETLRAKQDRFAGMVAELIRHCHAFGYVVTFGEAWRSDEEAARLARAGRGISRSLHCDRLAIDLNLFFGDVWLKSTGDHKPIGEFWESIGGTWGGRFGDGNHYSLTHEGRK
ncbi:MAG: M15 family metallopeptidase [Microbacteriaceae bacterium]